MIDTLHIVMCDGKQNYYDLSGAESCDPWQYYAMDDDNINGGLNHLEAWRRKAGMSQAELAAAVETTQGMIAHLESDRRGLSAKWLRRLAPALKTTPGLLLDHNPDDLSADVIDMWSHADLKQKRQITDIARTIVADGTNG